MLEFGDSRVPCAGVTVRNGRKWSAQEELDRAESRLRHRAMVGTVAMGRAGLGAMPQPHYNRAQGRERRQLVLKEVRAEIEDERTSRMMGMRMQGAWTRCEGALEKKITWSELWRAKPQRIKFLIQAVYDVLPSPVNLHIWGKSDTPACTLCSGRGSLEHILSSCPTALGEGRYRWHHDQVLKTIAEAITRAMVNTKHVTHHKGIRFVRAGEQPQVRPRSPAGVLTSAANWELQVDLGRQLRFPDQIVATTLRPDLVLVSAFTYSYSNALFPGKTASRRRMNGSSPSTRSWWNMCKYTLIHPN